MVFQSLLFLTVGCAITAGTVSAQTAAWPSQPIRIVVTQGAGSGSDIVARLLANQMAVGMKHSVIVDNRPGAAGTIGHQSVARSTPDGHTLLLTSTGLLLVVPAMMSSAKFRYTDFTPVSAVNSASFVVLVPTTPGSPTTLKELLVKIGTVNANYGSSGAGTMAHLASTQILRKAGVIAQHVPYKSNAQVLQDLAGGLLTFASDSATSALPLIQGGRLRALAVTGHERLVSLPNVPTLEEAGLPGLTVTTLSGLLGPKDLPKAIVEKLHEAVQSALQSPEVRDRLIALDAPPVSMTLSDFESRLRNDAAVWERLVKQLQLRSE